MGPDYKLGLQRLKEMLLQKDNELPTEFAALETRLLKVLAEERRYGNDDLIVKGNFIRVMDDLHSFTREYFTIFFNELCDPSYQQPIREASPTFTHEQPLTAKGRLASEPTVSPSIDEEVGKYWAVLVGVGEYEDKDYHSLPACVKDVKAVAQQLTHNGYASRHMRLLVDKGIDEDPLIKKLTGEKAELSKPTHGNIIEALRTVANKTQPEDLLLFYYTGHGSLADNESYLVTHNGRRGSLKYTALAISALTEIMHAAPARKKVIILDTCRTAVAPDSKGVPQPMPPAFIERVFEQAQGIAILTSCDAGENSYVWTEQERSVFTYYLLEALQSHKADFNGKERMSAEDIYQYVYERVERWATLNNCSQNPRRTVDGRGSIVVAYYQQEPVDSAAKTPEERASAFAALRKGARSWKEISMLTIQGERYEIEHASVRECLTEDDGATLREAKVRHIGTDLALWLKQVHIMGPDRHGKIVQEMLKKERQILIDLENEGYRDFPHIFPLIDGDSEKDFTFAYIATPDQSLKQAFSGLRQKPDKSAIERLIGNVLPLCGALGVLHGKSWSHRRLSPEEVFLLKGRYAMLQNIGLAAAQKPKKGECSGWYQAPEQREENTDLTTIGPATDIYQLGAILYFLMTNQLLSPGSLPGMYNPEVSPSLNEIIARAVVRQPEERWPTVEAFATALRQAQ